MTNIEKYQKRAKSIKETLTELKNHVSEDSESKQKEAYNELDSLKKEIDEELVDLKNDSESNQDEIKKLEEIIVNLNSFQRELDDLKNNISSKEENKDTPSFLASIFYGGIIGKGLGSLPLIGDSIKNRADKKLQSSGNQREKTKEKRGFWSKLRGFAKGTAIATGGFRLAKKIFGWLGKRENNEEKDNKNPENDPKDPNQNIESDSKVTNSVIVTQDPEGNTEVEQQEKIKTDASVENLESPQDGNQEVERLQREGYSDLFILIRMYELGFIPRTNFEKWRGGGLRSKTKRVFEGGRLDKLGAIRGNFKSRLLGVIKFSKEERIKMKLEAIKNKSNKSVLGAFDAEVNKLAEMHEDIEKGKIKEFKEFKAKYGNEIIKSKWKFKNAKSTLEGKYEKFNKAEAEVKKIDVEIKNMKMKATEELKNLDNQAKKSQKDPKKLKEIQTKANVMIEEYNKQILELEKQTGIKMSHLDATEIGRLAQGSETVSKIVKLNNGIDKYLAGNKIGKFMIGGTVIMLLSKGVEGATDETWKQVGLEAADLGTGLIPFAGGIYDITTSITGKGFAGNLSTTDRIIRGSVGAVSLVLDVAGLFTFGAGNVASIGVKTLSRAGISTAKTVKIFKTAKVISEVGSTAMKVGTYGFLGYSAYEMSKPYVVEGYQRVDKKRESDIPLTIK